MEGIQTSGSPGSAEKGSTSDLSNALGSLTTRREDDSPPPQKKGRPNIPERYYGLYKQARNAAARPSKHRVIQTSMQKYQNLGDHFVPLRFKVK